MARGGDGRSPDVKWRARGVAVSSQRGVSLAWSCDWTRKRMGQLGSFYGAGQLEETETGGVVKLSE